MIDKIQSDQVQVLLIGVRNDAGTSIAVHKVDLAIGACTVQPSLLRPEGLVIVDCMAGRLPDGRIVCAGTTHKNFSSEKRFDENSEDVYEEDSEVDDGVGLQYAMGQVLEPPPRGSPSDASWQWRSLPGTNVGHFSGSGCMLSDGRFAVFGGLDSYDACTLSCEVLTLDADGEGWDLISPMHEPRQSFACAAIGGCVIVAGGIGSVTAEVYEEELGRWRRLPCNLPYDSELFWMGSAVI